MKIVLTGTGTSQGIPVIGCHCEVCRSTDPKDKRLRTAAFIQEGETHLAIDAGPDFRQQMLSLAIDHLDALVLTHEHNDHVAGLDDIRPFNFRQGQPLKVYALPRVAEDLKHRFAYIFSEHPYPGAPQIDLIEITPYQEYQVGEITFNPFLVKHGSVDILALNLKRLCYITDANQIPAESEIFLEGCQTLILNALHHRNHHSHFNLEQAIKVVERYRIPHAYFIHISHHMGLHKQINEELPTGIELGYDGQIIRF